MEDLIKALQIFLKYGNPEHPTICSHDELIITEIEPENVSDADKVELEKHQIQIDHIIPVCKGGTNEFKNLAVCCKFCNVMKFGFSLKDYLQHLAHIRSKYFNCSILDSYSGELTGLEFDRINSTLFELDTENL